MLNKFDYLIVGAGFAGSVFAERAATQLNKKVLIVEKRNHIGGNAYDEYDNYDILIHKYGPHIFHTNYKKVVDYLSQFTEWRKYEHKVLAKFGNDFYPMPINRTTINLLYNKEFKNDLEVEKFYNSVKVNRYPIKNSEDIIISKVGKDLYERFFKYYTLKQWNLDPKKLSPSVCGRIPVRTNADDRYFGDRYQLMPKQGYTKMFEKMLKHKNIKVMLNTDYKSIINDIEFDKLVYTGPIDYFFDYKFGKLPYRSLRFEWKNYKRKKYQNAAVINHVEAQPRYTRVTEYKYLTGQESDTTTISKEFPKKRGEPYYPIPTDDNMTKYKMYKQEADKLSNVIFIGRLAEYKYYNMDQVVAKVLRVIKEEIK